MSCILFEDLQYFVYQHGLDEACKLLHITSKKVGSVLFGKEERKIKKVMEEEAAEVKKINTDNMEALYISFSSNYEYLYNLFKGNKRKNEVDQNSLDYEDRFHESFLKVLEISHDFEPKSESETLGYIKKCLFNHEKTLKNKAKRAEKKQKVYENYTKNE